MKRFLSLMLALLLVFVIGANVVLADEVATETTETPAVVEDTKPEGYDENTIKMYGVLNMADENNVTLTVGVTANDVTLAELKKNYEAQEIVFEEKKYGDVKLIVETENPQVVDAETLKMLNIANLEKKGFFVDEKFCVLPGILPYYISSLLGYSQYGMYLNGVVVDFEKGGYGVINGKMKDNAVVLTMDMESEILPESVIVTKTSINLLNVLIAVMILVVIILAVIIILLSFKNKKSAKKQESLKTEKYVSEDAVFEELVDEAGIDYDDEEADDEESDEVEADDESEETEEDAEEDK